MPKRSTDKFRGKVDAVSPKCMLAATLDRTVLAI